jgi:alpha/beta hydrolase fold
MFNSWSKAAAGAALVALVAAGCGGKHSAAGVTEQSFGSGPNRVWIFRPPGKPTTVVLFLHGQGGVRETTPFYHRPWLAHLARKGSIVLYPRYELVPGAPGAVPHVANGLRTAEAHVDVRSLPLLAIGYSRGGWLVFPSALAAARDGLRLRAILSVFPVTPEQPFDFRRMPKGTLIDVLAGDRDRVVGKVGAVQIFLLLGLARYPGDLTSAKLVRSHGDFVASHLSVLETSPAARAAYWARADRLIDRITS